MTRLTVARVRKSATARTRRLLSSWYFSNRHFYQKAIRRRASERAWRRLTRSQPKLIEFTMPMLGARSKASSSVTMGTKAKGSELRYLVEGVLRWRPRSVLECGAGTSTVALAFGLMKIHLETGIRGHLISMEENHEYLNELVIANFPQELMGYVDFVESQKSFIRYSTDDPAVQYDGICYTDVPKREYDLIYVDGPSYSTTPGKRAFEHVSPEADYSQVRGSLFNSDCLNYLLEASSSTRIVLDQRISTRWAWKQLFRGRYRVGYNFSATKSEFVVGPENVRHIHRTPLTSVSSRVDEV